jgi:hypothetical protein
MGLALDNRLKRLREDKQRLEIHLGKIMNQFDSCSDREAQLELQIRKKNAEKDAKILELQEKPKVSGGWVSTGVRYIRAYVESSDDAGLNQIRAALKTYTEDLVKERTNKSTIEDTILKVQVPIYEAPTDNKPHALIFFLHTLIFRKVLLSRTKC